MNRSCLFLALAVLVAAPLASSRLLAADANRPPTLRIPGMDPIPLPHHGQGSQATPGDDEPPAASDNPSSHLAPKGEVAAPAKSEPPPRSRAQTLDDLYARLAAASDAEETAGLAAAIDRLELESGSDAGNLLMGRAIAAMGIKNYEVAQTLFDRIIALHPEWAEAWNKRATVRFLLEDDEGAMADIAHVLKIEPRHFGALAGMGMILERRGFDADALRAYRRALEIAPHLGTLQADVDRLTKSVKGQDL